MNASLTRIPTTDPAQILRYRDRQYAAELLAAALLHFDFFTWLKDHPDSDTDAMAGQFGFSKRPLDVLLTLCRANGFIETDGRGIHKLTRLAREHLVKGSPWYLGPYYSPIKNTPIVQSFLKVLQTGKPANWQARQDGDDWHESMLSDGFAREFTELMNCRGLALGQALARSLTPALANRKRILDVGGGSGIYASTLLAVHEQLTATVLEQPPVDAIVRKEVEKHGLSGRLTVVAGNMFKDPWPEGADVVLLSNVLHDWDVAEVRALLENSAKALPVGGLLVIHEAFINKNKSGPLPVAEYSALLMNITQGKCYSTEEYASILRELGFEIGPEVNTIADRGYMTAVKR